MMPQRAKVSRSCFFKIRNLFGEAETKRVRLPFQKSGVEQAGHRVRGNGSVSDAAARSFHLDQRLQPEHAARTVADHEYVAAARSDLFRDRAGDGVGAYRERRGVARNINLHAHAASARYRSRNRRPPARLVRRVCHPASPPEKARNCPSSRPVPRVKLPSGVVSPSLTPRRFSTCRIMRSQPMDWHDFRAAHLQHVAARRLVAKIVIETDHAVHFGLRNIQRARRSAGRQPCRCIRTLPAMHAKSEAERRAGAAAPGCVLRPVQRPNFGCCSCAANSRVAVKKLIQMPCSYCYSFNILTHAIYC